MSTVTSERRYELGAFLRARRAERSPADAGFAPSSRRRTPGLRREEVAVLAGISTTWYTFLEQGRDAHPSHQVLVAIANALHLDEAEKAHLFAMAADTTVVVDDLEYIAPEVADIPTLVDPNPAYVTGSSYDLLAWNDAAAKLFPGATDGSHPNLALWMFLDPTAHDVLPEWTTVAQGLLARLRAHAGRYPGSPRFQRLEQELRSGSSEADAWWRRYDIGTSQSGVKRVRPHSGPEQLLSYASFHVANQPEQLLTIYRTV